MTFDEQYVRMNELCETFGVVRQTIARWVAEGSFPKPLRFNLRRQVWIRKEIEAHMQQLADVRDAAD